MLIIYGLILYQKKTAVIRAREVGELVEYNGKQYLWIGEHVYSNDVYYGLGAATKWINQGLNNRELIVARNYFNDYNESEREDANECHDNGCCIDCFNGLVNTLYGIKENELNNSGVPGHNQTINHTLDVLEKKGLAQSIGSFTPVTDNSGNPIGYNGLEAAILESTNNIRGVYYFGVSLGNGYHSTTLELDYRDPNNPIYTYYDQNLNRHEEFNDFNELINHKYLKYADSQSTYGTDNYNVDLIISKIHSNVSD